MCSFQVLSLKKRKIFKMEDPEAIIHEVSYTKLLSDMND